VNSTRQYAVYSRCAALRRVGCSITVIWFSLC
jgi:hypothetical protein